MNHYTNENHEFYNSMKWKKLRKKIMRRDKYLCQICKRFGRNTEANVVHHIIFLNDDWDKRTDEDNLVSLCHKHHNQLHKAEEFNG